MAVNISLAKIKNLLKKVKHPAIDRTLFDLGIIHHVEVKNNKIVITLAFPFENIPIKDYLINSVKKALDKLGMDIVIKTVVMSQTELQKFLNAEQKYWKG